MIRKLYSGVHCLVGLLVIAILSSCVSPDQALRNGFNGDIKRAESGDLDSIARLGYNHFFGLRSGEDSTGLLHQISIAQDYKKALFYLRRAGDMGHARCATLAGIILMQGLGVTKDQFAAIQYLEIGREHGITKAYTRLGDAYLHGYGTPKNYAKALSYLTVSAKRGDPEAMESLADIHLNGWGVPEQPALAQKLKKQAKVIRNKQAARRAALNTAMVNAQKRQLEFGAVVASEGKKARETQLLLMLGGLAIANIYAATANPGPYLFDGVGPLTGEELVILGIGK